MDTLKKSQIPKEFGHRAWISIYCFDEFFNQVIEFKGVFEVA
jgi:hypothetical protein